MAAAAQVQKKNLRAVMRGVFASIASRAQTAGLLWNAQYGYDHKDYRDYSPPQTYVTQLLPRQTETQPRIVKPTPDEIVRVAVGAAKTVGAINPQLPDEEAFERKFGAINQFVTGDFKTKQARNNAIYHLLPIVASRGPIAVEDVSDRILQPQWCDHYTTLKLPAGVLFVPDREIVTVSGLPAEEELRLMQPTVSEMHYVLRQRDPNLRNLQPVFEFILSKFETQERMLNDINRKVRPVTFIEDIRGHVIYDAIKTAASWLLRGLGIPL